jgi:membrane protease YdiL (CAAX protease family)
MASTAVLGFNMLVLKKEATELDPISMIVATGIFTLTTIAVFAWMKWSPLSKTFLRSRRWDILLWSIVASLGAIIPSSYLQELLPEWPASIQQQIDQMARTMFQMMNTPGGYAVICLFAPIAEEMVFRGAALRKLLQWKPERRWLMITFSAVLFAVAHMNPAQIIHPLLIGLLLGWMYERTGSIIPGVAYHWANNTAAYLLARLYQDPDITVTQIMGSQSRALMAVGFSLLIFIPAIYQLNVWMKKPEKPYFKR